MNDSHDNQQLQLHLENLEDRQMLSAVDIFAAGVTNDETIELQIDGAVVQTWENVGGNADAAEFVQLTYNSDQDIDPGKIRIGFVNDQYDPSSGTDRNVRIDKIVVDGVTIETESAEVFSTGTWKPDDGITPGFRESEYLHTNGYFQYPANDSGEATGSVIEIRARGDEGTEQFNLVVQGRLVGSYQVSSEMQSFRYTHNETVSADDVRVEFINDQWDPAAGIDSNLTVDSITIDGEIFETEDPSVFSTGTWKAEDGTVAGNRESETLHTNGYSQAEHDGVYRFRLVCQFGRRLCP